MFDIDVMRAFHDTLAKEAGLGQTLGNAATAVGSRILSGGTRLLAKASPNAATGVMNYASKVGPERMSKYVGGAALGAGVLGAGALGAGMLRNRQQPGGTVVVQR